MHEQPASIGVINRLSTWAKDHLTVGGREQAIFTRKYNQVVEQLPKDATDNQLALLEMKLRSQSHSAAISSLVVDGLAATGAFVGGGILLGKMSEQAKIPQAARVRASRLAEKRTNRAFKAIKDVSYGALKTGVDVAMAGVKLVVTPIEWGAKVVTWPIRQVGRAGEYLWGITLGPVVNVAADLTQAALEVPGNIIHDVDWATTKIATKVDQKMQLNQRRAARRLRVKELQRLSRERLKNIAARK